MIEPLGAGSESEVARIGGKAAGLVRLLGAGLTVPEAWVIPAGESADAFCLVGRARCGLLLGGAQLRRRRGPRGRLVCRGL